MKRLRIKYVCLFVFAATALVSCGGQKTDRKLSVADTAFSDGTLQKLQGIWIDEETSMSFCMIKGDSIFYPDSLNVPLRIMARIDKLALIGSDTVLYPIDVLTENRFCFHSTTGDNVCLRRSEDPNDTVFFSRKESTPIIYNEVVKKDTVVFCKGDRYRCYIYVNPSKYKVYKQSYTNEGVAVENVYYDNVIHICVYKGKTCLYAHNYSRKSFVEIIPEEFLQQAVLADMKYGYTDDDGFCFYASVCVPDGAICYVVEIRISPHGEVRMNLLQ